MHDQHMPYSSRWPLIAACGVAILGFAAAGRLAAINAEIRQSADRHRKTVSVVPVVGSLSGRALGSGKEWDGSRDMPSALVLFPISDTQAGSQGFWRTVVQDSKKSMPEIAFAGVCISPEWCADARGVKNPFEIISAMDPLQMRALTIANENGRALLFRGTAFVKWLDVPSTPSAFVADLFAQME